MQAASKPKLEYCLDPQLCGDLVVTGEEKTPGSVRDSGKGGIQNSGITE